MRILTIACLVGLAGCSSGGWGYWPKVEGSMGAMYQTDVRECQTATQSGATQAIGSAVWLAMASKFDEGHAKIDDCMSKRGYHVIKASN
jgi:hypothetical protein